jgi:hypothetical protein
MRDFVGMEHADQLTREAMMNFSYYLTVGNMDEAYKVPSPFLSLSLPSHPLLTPN